MTWFIDRLTICQTHHQRLPLIGDKGYMTVDLHTGETSNEVRTSKTTVQASHSTSLRVSCDGHTVTVEGNPSRFGRIENLVGLTCMEDCVAVYNQVLLRLGLPPFTTGHFEFLQGKDGEKQRKFYSGAIIKHVDVTKNHCVGYKNERPFLRAVATLSLPNGKHPFLYPNGCTVDFSTTRSTGGSSWDYTKIYVKAAELIEHEKKNLKNATPEDEKYYRDLVEHCAFSGIVREEHSWKAKKLARYDLCYYGYVTLDQLVNHHTMTTLESLIKTLEVATVDYITIADQLIQRNIVKSRQAANATAHYCHQWQHGMSFHDTDKKRTNSSQYYVHKARLLALGIDISVPFCPTRNVIPTIHNRRTIERSDFVTPPWYRHATTRPTFELINCGIAA